MLLLGLPLEILWWISKSLDIKELRSLCLVSTDFNSIFRERLFDCIDLGETPPIHWAIKHKCLSIVRYSMHWKKAKLNEEHLSLTPLMLAAKLGYAEAVELLLGSDSVKISYRNHLGESAFSLAVANESAQVVERLISEQNIDINDHLLDGDLPLTIALKSRQSYIFQLILSDARTDTGLRDYHGQTPLHKAVEMGDESAIQMLVRNQRVDVNYLNHRQETPLLLHFKRYGRFLPIDKQLRIIAALLLSPFINLNHRDKDGRTTI
jgi:ankyrin repeat protein